MTSSFTATCCYGYEITFWDLLDIARKRWFSSLADYIQKWTRNGPDSLDEIVVFFGGRVKILEQPVEGEPDRTTRTAFYVQYVIDADTKPEELADYCKPNHEIEMIMEKREKQGKTMKGEFRIFIK
jgi:hypothetical protein